MHREMYAGVYTGTHTLEHTLPCLTCHLDDREWRELEGTLEVVSQLLPSVCLFMYLFIILGGYVHVCASVCEGLSPSLVSFLNHVPPLFVFRQVSH